MSNWREPVDISPETKATAVLDTTESPTILVICACGFNLGEEEGGLDPFNEQSIICPECDRIYIASVDYTYSVQEIER